MSKLKKSGSFIAVDLGAGSGRVMLARFTPDRLDLEMVHRFPSSQHVVGGHERWDVTKIFAEIETGIAAALKIAPDAISVGADSWGVDYGYIDDVGKLLADPVCYRDSRTVGQMEKVGVKISHETLYQRTGIPSLIFNSIYQLAAEVEKGSIPANAKRWLMIPDLVHHHLSGLAANEYSDASTSQLLLSAERDWDRETMKKLGIPEQLFVKPSLPGTKLGPIKKELAARLGSHSLSVVLPAGHDTASAVVGTPLKEGSAFLSSGTWSLLGLERKEAMLTTQALGAGFSNEGGAYGTYRFLKNVMGLWVLESARKKWKERGDETDYGKLISALSTLPDRGFIFPDHADFFNPEDATAVIEAQLGATGQAIYRDAASQAKIIFDSLAQRYASVIERMEAMTGKAITEIRIVGGGSQNDYLNQQTANATGKRVIAGPLEATAIGNVLVQAIAAGCFDSIEDGRAYVDAMVTSQVFEPVRDAEVTAKRKAYLAVEAKLGGSLG